MILPDANLLLYAYDEGSPHYKRSRAWLTEAVASREPLGLATSTIVTFLRIATSPRVFVSPLRIECALEAIEALAEHEHVIVVGPGPSHLQIFRELLVRTRATSDLVPDAYLAALAREHHATVYTNDHDFDRFVGVSVAYPLETKTLKDST